jgi:enoyl-CoA hydratase/carnithine racemase
VSAEQAEKLNMIYKAVDDETFEEEVLKFAETLAVMPPRGLGLTKKAVNTKKQAPVKEAPKSTKPKTKQGGF